MIKTSLEQYVEQLGIMGTLTGLRARINVETNPDLREYFLACQALLVHNRGGRLIEAEQRYQSK